MKKTVLLPFVLLTIITAQAQEDGVKLDMLKAPVSPASNLLGIATSDIDKPTDVSAFMLSLQSASNSFTRLPSNYAVDVAPFLLFAKKSPDVTTSGLKSKKFGDIFRQTFIISTAIRNPDSTETTLNTKNTYAGIGIKFSFWRGKYDDKTTDELDRIHDLQDTMLHYVKAALKKWITGNDPEAAKLKLKRDSLLMGRPAAEIDKIMSEKGGEYEKLTKAIGKRQQDFIDNEVKEQKKEIGDRIKEIASDFQTNRIGFSLDFNAGLSGEFINKQFNNSRVYNAGVWTNFGYTTKSYGAFLGLIRYLYNPDKVFALDNKPTQIQNISTLDAGVRYAYAKSQSKFSCSLEGIYRSVLSSNTIDPSWRVIFNADYAIFQNQKLTFSFGRNFDGTITKDGNLVAAISFLAGFGNKR